MLLAAGDLVQVVQQKRSGVLVIPFVSPLENFFTLTLDLDYFEVE